MISSGAKQEKVAKAKLAQFTLMLERGEIVCGVNPFLRSIEPKPAQLLIADALEAFELDLRAGRVRRGKRKPV